MVSAYVRRKRLLILEDVDETRYLLETMLEGTDYWLTLTRDVEETILSAALHSPDLVLMSLAAGPGLLLDVALNIRRRAGLSSEVAFVIFCVPNIPQGAEIEVGKNIFLTRPDNFDQLRTLIYRLLWTALPS